MSASTGSFRDVLKRMSEDELLLLLDRDATFQRKAAIELGRRRANRAVSRLIDLLQSHEAPVRSAAADALGLIGDPAAGPRLIDVLRDREQHAGVRDAVAYALGRLRFAPAVDALCDALSDDAASVRLCAASALAAIGDSRACYSISSRPPDRA